MRGAGTGTASASAGSIEAAVTHSTAKARGATRFSLVVNICNPPIVSGQPILAPYCRNRRIRGSQRCHVQVRKTTRLNGYQIDFPKNFARAHQSVSACEAQRLTMDADGRALRDPSKILLRTISVNNDCGRPLQWFLRDNGYPAQIGPSICRVPPFTCHHSLSSPTSASRITPAAFPLHWPLHQALNGKHKSSHLPDRPDC